MSPFRRPSRLAVSLKPGGGRAVFRHETGGDPVWESWDPFPPPLARKNMLGFKTTCCGREGLPFLQFDVRTPYGEVAEESGVVAAGREALGPRADQYPISGWQVSHLADTNLGSNHRIFATLGGEREGLRSGEVWDQVLPLETALLALGDFAARKTGNPDFQLILDQGAWVYSLIYRDAQPWHLFRLAEHPLPHMKKRLREHRRQIPDAPAAIPIFVLGSERFRQDCVETFGATIQPLELPAGISREDGEPNAWHYGLALAATQEEFSVHNLVSPALWEKNHQARLLYATARRCALALLAAAVLFAAEAGRFFLSGYALKLAKAGAAAHEETLATLQTLRAERADLFSTLSSLRPLWIRPASVPAVLGEISRALPAAGGLDGLFLRRSEGGKMEAAFRAHVDDWNQIRPFQESLQGSSLFSRVDFTDQRQDPRLGVVFQGTCVLADRP